MRNSLRNTSGSTARASSWEVDALPPNVLERLIRQAILSHLDEDMRAEVIAREERDKKMLLKAVAEIQKKKKGA